MERVQPIEPITQMQKQPNSVQTKLVAGPVIVAQRSRPAAVLVNVEPWDQIAKEGSTLRLLAESRRIAVRNDADYSWVPVPRCVNGWQSMAS